MFLHAEFWTPVFPLPAEFVWSRTEEQSTANATGITNIQSTTSTKYKESGNIDPKQLVSDIRGLEANRVVVASSRMGKVFDPSLEAETAPMVTIFDFCG